MPIPSRLVGLYPDWMPEKTPKYDSRARKKSMDGKCIK